MTEEEQDINETFIHDIINKLMGMQGKILKIKRLDLPEISDDIVKLESVCTNSIELVTDYKSYIKTKT